MEIKTNRRDALDEITFGDGQRRLLAETDGAVAKLNNIAQEKILRKYSVRGEQPEELETRRKAKTPTSRANDKPQLYHPLASSELHGVTYQARRYEKSAEEKLTKQPEAAEARIDDREAVECAEFEEGVGTTQGDSQIIVHRGKSTEIPAGNTRKFERYDKSDKASHCDRNVGMFTASDLERKREKTEGKRRKWIKKRYVKEL